jgi:ribonuclease P protein component
MMGVKLLTAVVQKNEDVLLFMPKREHSHTSWTTKEIIALHRQAITVASYPELVAKRAPTSGSQGRMLLVIPKKVGTAPERNLLRRRMKAIMYENKLYERGYDWLFFFQSAVKKWSFQQLASVIITICTAP